METTDWAPVACTLPTAEQPPRLRIGVPSAHVAVLDALSGRLAL